MVYHNALSWVHFSFEYIIYINQLVHSNSGTNNQCNNDFVLFADDTNIFVAGQNEEEVYLNKNNYINE